MIRMHPLKLYLGFWLILNTAGFCDVRSFTGNILFDVQSDGQAEMSLNSTGLGIGAFASSSLHVNGNAIITQQLLIGSGSSTSNLMVNGTIGFGFQRLSASANLGVDSYVLVDSSISDIVLSLPNPAEVAGRVYTIKKISTTGRVTLEGPFVSEEHLCLENDALGCIRIVSSGANWQILSSLNAAKLLFVDRFTNSLSSNTTDPVGRAVGLLASVVKYNISNNTTGQVAVTGNVLDWTGTNNADGQLDASNGTQSWTFSTSPAGATYFDWGPYLANKVYYVSFTYRSAKNHPLTFGLTDEPDAGHWNAVTRAEYDFACRTTQTNFETGSDGSYESVASLVTYPMTYNFLIKFDEPMGTATVYLDGVLRATRSINFILAGRYFSFAEPTLYAGYIDDFMVSVYQ